VSNGVISFCAGGWNSGEQLEAGNVVVCTRKAFVEYVVLGK